MYILYERESFLCSDAVCQKLVLKALFYLPVLLPHFRDVALVIFFKFCIKTCKLEKEELVFLLCLNVKIHGMSQETRLVTCVLGLEGIALR
jgi:hypothetical protein